jgi:hypothetical protein
MTFPLWDEWPEGPTGVLFTGPQTKTAAEVSLSGGSI